MSQHHRVLIIGGGAAGISVAARLRDLDDPLDVGIVEPSEDHYYQPLWTLVGGGVFDKEKTRRPEAEQIPDGAEWIREAATEFRPEDNTVVTDAGGEYTYDYLVVAAGIQLEWDRVKGLEGNVGSHGICSNYSYETVDSTWDALRHFRGGNAIFTFPDTAIKCAGAPQKIMWLAEHWMRKQGVRDDANVVYAASTDGIFGIDKYARTLSGLIEERDVDTHYNVNLVEVVPEDKKAIFEHLDDPSADPMVLDYDMLHVTPPQGPPDFIAESPIADEDGWVDVDKYTTQHVDHPNIFSLGDCSSLPTSKTGAAVRKEVPVTVENLLAEMQGEPLEAEYNGYASCPLVTGYGRLVLCEFDYDGNPDETFPFDQSRERYSMYALKAYGLPDMYWHGMLRGRM
jgi:sulfide:quinone oxidoreductase